MDRKWPLCWHLTRALTVISDPVMDVRIRLAEDKIGWVCSCAYDGLFARVWVLGTCTYVLCIRTEYRD